jgi:hypothetical protein
MSVPVSPERDRQDPKNRLHDICLTLPEVSCEVAGQHLTFRVRGRTFAYYLEDHHGDGEIAMVCKAEPGLNQSLVESDPQRFFMPAYVGPRGWVAARLEGEAVDWDEIADLVFESFCLIAPKRLVSRVVKERRRIAGT